eukprot:15449104-Alexandrium_andersonii.AAC.1
MLTGPFPRNERPCWNALQTPRVHHRLGASSSNTEHKSFGFAPVRSNGFGTPVPTSDGELSLGTTPPDQQCGRGVSNGSQQGRSLHRQ